MTICFGRFDSEISDQKKTHTNAYMPYFPTNMYVDPLSTIKVDLKIITKTYKKPPFKKARLLFRCCGIAVYWSSRTWPSKKASL